MFSKPLSFALVYIVTIFNITVLLSPFVAFAMPFISFENNVISIDNGIYAKIKYGFMLTCFSVSFLMICYLIIDFFIGFSVRLSLKKCQRYEKIRDYDFLTDIFDQVKNKFGQRSVKLYIKDSDEINAFAVSSIGSRAIVLTKGLIDHYLLNCEDPKIFLYALRSVMSHEMSHLINKDFLPSYLIIINQKITNFASFILYRLFALTVRFVRMLPFGGGYSQKVMIDTYTIFNFAITFFNRFVVYNVYEFLRRFISRGIEYRCDRQAAKAFGGNNMALALSMMGESGYFTLFSTHPRTSKRMQKVAKISIEDRVVSARFFDILSNYFSLMLLVVICLYFAKQAYIDVLVRNYIKHHEAINRKVSYFWYLMHKFF